MVKSMPISSIVWGPDLIAQGQNQEARIRSGDSCSISVCSSECGQSHEMHILYVM